MALGERGQRRFDLVRGRAQLIQRASLEDLGVRDPVPALAEHLDFTEPELAKLARHLVDRLHRVRMK